ncbi:MAG: Rid family detoxifying hydrolase [Patescibacteria group bacterium]|jgi:2-iminobutanoate/2-iminopropanoate deaminase
MQIIHTDQAPEPIGPYSQAIMTNNGFLFLSGQIAIKAGETSLIDGSTVAQARLIFDNIDAILDAAGLTRASLARVEILMADMADFKAVNEAYGEWLGLHRPARAAYQPAKLPLGAKIEIIVIAEV